MTKMIWTLNTSRLLCCRSLSPWKPRALTGLFSGLQTRMKKRSWTGPSLKGSAAVSRSILAAQQQARAVEQLQALLGISQASQQAPQRQEQEQEQEQQRLLLQQACLVICHHCEAKMVLAFRAMLLSLTRPVCQVMLLSSSASIAARRRRCQSLSQRACACAAELQHPCAAWAHGQAQLQQRSSSSWSLTRTKKKQTASLQIAQPAARDLSQVPDCRQNT